MNVADLLAGRLASLGVRRVFGMSLPVTDEPACPVRLLQVVDADVALLLASADGRIGEVDGRGRLGAALMAGPVLHLSSEPGGEAPLQTVGTPEELLDALVDPPGMQCPATSSFHLDLDLAAPVPTGLVAAVQPERRPVITLDPSMSGLEILMLVGPGVVRAGAVGAMRDASRSLGSGVLNTWGAKGVERRDSPWHFGTAGLQADDLALARVDDADLVITSGLDPLEVPGTSPMHMVVQDVSPSQLGALCQSWPLSAGPPARPPALFDAIAEVVRPMYEIPSTGPLNPARASLQLSGALPDRAMAVADPGPAGFWVARTFPTSIPNSMCVPAAEAPGFAAAAAMCAAMDRRPVLAVTDHAGAAHPLTGAVLERAEAEGVGLGLQVWGPEGDRRWSTPQGHVRLLAEHLGTSECRVDAVGLDLSAAPLVALAGDVVAWR